MCELPNELGIKQVNAQELARFMQDPRIRVTVSFDLGLARGFTQQSLENIDIPVLILGAGINIGDLPAELESGYLHKYIPSKYNEYVLMPNITHFSFIQVCKAGAATILEEENAGDGIICFDGEGLSRTKIHEQISQKVIQFLTEKLPK